MSMVKEIKEKLQSEGFTVKSEGADDYLVGKNHFL